jgi:hypothetical protein
MARPHAIPKNRFAGEHAPGEEPAQPGDLYERAWLAVGVKVI